MYTWPSAGVVGLSGYNRDGRNAELSASVLKNFLESPMKNGGDPACPA